MNFSRWHLACSTLLTACAAPTLLPPLSPATTDDPAQYRTVSTALRAQPNATTNALASLPYFGFAAQMVDGTKLGVTAIAPDSPAAKAGMAVGDLLMALEGRPVASMEALRQALAEMVPGRVVRITVSRAGHSLQHIVTPQPLSSPMPPPTPRAVTGVQMALEADRVVLRQVVAGSPAERAGLKPGDVILKLGERDIHAPDEYQAYISEKKPGDQVAALIRRGSAEMTVPITLGGDTAQDFSASPFATRTFWKKESYRLAVVPIDFSDMRHDRQIPTSAWKEALFSTNTHTKTNATGAKSFGSMRDYYEEISAGAFKLQGAVFEPVELSQKRADSATATTGQARSAFFTVVLDRLHQRDGPDALKGFDGLAFIYAGERLPTANRASLFWPHRDTLTYKAQRMPYFICPEGGRQMESISVFCHEFGHMLGLPDLYARPENPGSEGMGNWCAMSNVLRGGRPQHFSAWCKAELGWLTPASIDPRVPQKLILSPVEGSGRECFKVLLREDGSEFLLLENRARKGFDAGLPGEGLLIWRVVGGRPMLEESHGVQGPAGPRAHLAAVPYPSAANERFTPFTMPSSRPQLGGGWPAHITNIRRLPDGRVSFHIGYEYH